MRTEIWKHTDVFSLTFIYSVLVMQMIHNLFIVTAKNRHDVCLSSSEVLEQKQQTNRTDNERLGNKKGQKYLSIRISLEILRFANLQQTLMQHESALSHIYLSTVSVSLFV